MFQCERQSSAPVPLWANTAAGDGAAGREGGPESPHLGAGCCTLRLPLPPSLPPPDPLQLIKLFRQSLCASAVSVPGMARGWIFGTGLVKNGAQRGLPWGLLGLAMGIIIIIITCSCGLRAFKSGSWALSILPGAAACGCRMWLGLGEWGLLCSGVGS